MLAFVGLLLYISVHWNTRMTEMKQSGIEVLLAFADNDGNKAIIEIDAARCIKGALPSRQLKLILAWCVLHQDELMQNWELSKDGKPMNRINPLV